MAKVVKVPRIFKPLLEAVLDNNTPEVRKLIEENEDLLNKVFPFSSTRAIGHSRGDRDLHPFPDVDPYHFFLNEATPLIISIYANKLDIVSMLLKKGADVNLSFFSDDTKTNYTALVLAIFLKRTEIVKRLLEEEIDVDPKITAPDVSPDEFPLQMAIRTRQPEIAKMLLEKGADVNAKDKNGRTALDYAEGHSTGMERDEKCVKVLTDAGAVSEVPAVPAVPAAAVGPARGGAGGPSRSRSKRTRSNRRRAARRRTRKN